MSRSIHASLLCVTVGAGLTGCASAPGQTASSMASTTGHAIYTGAGNGAHAIYTTGGDVYSGVGAAAKQPFRDFNMMQDPIPPVLLRAESKPYDLSDVGSCAGLMNQVAELDLALGPDLDAPKDKGGDRLSKGADAAAAAALEAATSAAEGFLPMRSIIKTVSGATRYEKHVKHAVLAGTVRRSFLKAIGMEHNCGWPAEPLGYDAATVAAAEGRWPAGALSALQTASAATPVPAAPPGPRTQTVAVASAVSPAHPDVQAIAVSTSTGGDAPVTKVYMVANPARGRAHSARTVTVANVTPGVAGLASTPTVKVSPPTISRSGAVVASATVFQRDAQAITLTAPTSAQGRQVRAVVATSTVSAPARAGSPAVQTVSVTSSAGVPGRTVTQSRSVLSASPQTLTVDDPLRNAAPAAQVASNSPTPARGFASRSANVVSSPAAYPIDGAATGNAFAPSASAAAPTPVSAAPWGSANPSR